MTRIGHVYPYSSVYPGKFKPSLSFSETVPSPTWTGNKTGLSSLNIRQIIPASSISTGGSTVKVNFEAADSGTDSFSIILAYIGHKAASGDAWDFDGGQVKMTFGGVDAVEIAATGSVESDETTFTLDETKDLIISYGVETDTLKDVARSASDTGFSTYQGEASSNVDAGETTPSTYSLTNNARWGVGQILVAV